STGMVSGVAMNPQGIIAGAQVEVTSSTDLGYRGQTNTDSQGAYRISGVPYGGINGTVRRDGQVVARGTGVLEEPTGTARSAGVSDSSPDAIQVQATGPVFSPRKDSPRP